MCQHKWKSLKRTYKEIVDKKKKTGGAAAACRFLHFKEMDEILGKSPNIHPPVTYNSSHSGPMYRADVAAALPGSSSMSMPPLKEETPSHQNSQAGVAAALPGSSSMSMPPLNEETPSQQDSQGRLDLEEVTVTPKRGQRRELPYWSNLYFQRFDAVEAKKEEREKRRDEARERKEEERKRKEEARERREQERQKVHEDRQKSRAEILEILRNIENNKK